MHIFITGSAGFIASHLVEYIIAQGHTITGVDNYITGNKKNIENSIKNPQFHFIEHDILTFDYSTIQDPVDVVFHMASPASPIQYKKHPIETLDVNSVGTKQALNFASEKNATLVYASTSEVYGDPLVHPPVEWYWGNVNPNGVRSCYDEAKRFGEAMCMTYVRTKKTKVRIARIFNTFGPRMDVNDGRVVSNFIVQALRNEPITLYGTGEQTRSLCYVSDLVQGLWALGTKEIKLGEVINLGNPNELTVKEIAHKIKAATGSLSDIIQKPIDLDDPLKRKPDITKAKELLGWEPTISIDEGLRKTIDYFKSIL